MEISDEIINWLLESDPAIRYIVYKELLNKSIKEIEAERNKISHEGWGKQLLLKQDTEGTWAKSLYSQKWISTTYTLVLLKRLGLDPDNEQAKKGIKILLDKGIYSDGGINYFASLDHSETCVTGLILMLLCYFKIDDKRIDNLANFLFEQQMPDGGWNCQSFYGAKHSSMHTTLLALEGLWEYEKITPCMKGPSSESREKGIEFLLQHKLFKSDKTSKIIDVKMTRLVNPISWRYDFLLALEYLKKVNFLKDKRMEDSINILIKKRRKEGNWILNNRQPGKVHFEIEETGKPGKWITARVLGVLKWWGEN